MKYVRLAFVLFFASLVPAAAQWQTPLHSVPIGKGGGNIGFSAAVPGATGLPLVSTGASTDPGFGPLGLAGLPSGTPDGLLGYFGSSVASIAAIANCTGAWQYNGTSHAIVCQSGATDSVFTYGTGSTASFLALPNCQVALQYSTATHSWLCGPMLNTLTISSGASDAFLVGNAANSNAFTINSQGDIGVGTYLTPDATHHLSFEIMRNQNTDAAFTIRNRNAGASARAVIHMFADVADQSDLGIVVGSVAGGSFANYNCGAGLVGGCNFIQAAAGPINFFTSNVQRTTITSAGQWQFTSAGTTASAANAFLDGSNTLLKSTSSLRYKKELRDITKDETDEIMRLRPFTYASNALYDDPNARFFGFGAEDVAAVDPRLVNYDNEGRPDGVQYERIVVPLLKKVQDMNACMSSWKCRLFGVQP